MRYILLAATIFFVAVYLAAHRKPSWYRPVSLAPKDIPAVEASVANVLDAVGDSIVRRNPFEVVLHERQVNQWLAAAPALAQKWNRAWPAEIQSPALAFDDGSLRIGSHVRYRGWQAIAGVRLRPALSVDGENVTLTISQATIGAIPCPSPVWTSFADPRLENIVQARDREGAVDGARGRSFRLKIDSSQPGVRTLVVPNDFLWPNGQRRFRIGSISISGDGTMRLTVVPL